MVDAFLFDASLIFFATWITAVLTLGAIAFGPDLVAAWVPAGHERVRRWAGLLASN